MSEDLIIDGSIEFHHDADMIQIPWGVEFHFYSSTLGEITLEDGVDLSRSISDALSSPTVTLEGLSTYSLEDIEPYDASDRPFGCLPGFFWDFTIRPAGFAQPLPPDSGFMHFAPESDCSLLEVLQYFPDAKRIYWVNSGVDLSWNSETVRMLMASDPWGGEAPFNAQPPTPKKADMKTAVELHEYIYEKFGGSGKNCVLSAINLGRTLVGQKMGKIPRTSSGMGKEDIESLLKGPHAHEELSVSQARDILFGQPHGSVNVVTFGNDSSKQSDGTAYGHAVTTLRTVNGVAVLDPGDGDRAPFDEYFAEFGSNNDEFNIMPLGISHMPVR